MHKWLIVVVQLAKLAAPFVGAAVESAVSRLPLGLRVLGVLVLWLLRVLA